MRQPTHLAPSLSIWVRWSQAEAVVILCGDLDMVTVPDAETRLAAVLSRRPSRLVIDLRRLSFMDSTGVSLIANARRDVIGDVPFVLRGPNRIVRKVLRVTGVDRFCSVEDG